MKLATTAEHTKATEEMFEALESAIRKISSLRRSSDLHLGGRRSGKPDLGLWGCHLRKLGSGRAFGKFQNPHAARKLVEAF